VGDLVSFARKTASSALPPDFEHYSYDFSVFSSAEGKPTVWIKDNYSQKYINLTDASDKLLTAIWVLHGNIYEETKNDSDRILVMMSMFAGGKLTVNDFSSGADFTTYYQRLWLRRRLNDCYNILVDGNTRVRNYTWYDEIVFGPIEFIKSWQRRRRQRREVKNARIQAV